MIPHIKNNFSFCQNVNNFDILVRKLCNKNILHKKVVLSMNRIRIIRELLIKEKENERKQMIEEIQQRPILIWKNHGETKVNQYEKKFGKYELLYNNKYILKTKHFSISGQYYLYDFC